MLTTPTILMYHGIISSSADIPPNREAGADLYDLSLEKFKEQMQLIRDKGYRPSRIEDMAVYDPKKIIITFDDGEMNNFHNAYPVLKEYSFPAYFFVTANRIGQKGYMGFKELEVLSKNGMIVGSHGLTHSILTGLNEGELRKELSDSKTTLEKHLNSAVHYFSVPGGFYNEDVVSVAKDIRYRRMFVSQRLMEHGDYCLPRVAVKGNWNLERSQMVLAGKTPMRERIFEGVKNAAKGVLGGRGYDCLRNLVLRKKLTK